MSNKSAKQKLIEKYGNIDFLDQLKVTTPTGHTYTSKGQMKRMKQLSFHHIIMRKDGGPATVENGALLTQEHHIWFHQQPKEVQAKLNQAFQEFKRLKDKNKELEVTFEDLELPFELAIMDLSIDEKGELKVYNRAKIKEDTRKLVLEELEDGRE